MNLSQDDFPYREHWIEHKKFLKIEGARLYNIEETRGFGFLAFYAIGISDHKFMVRYGPSGPGDIDLYYLNASFDNVKTLQELISKEAIHNGN